MYVIDTNGKLKVIAAPSITGLSASDLAVGDEFGFYDISAAGNRKVTATKLGGFLTVGVSEFRLSLTSGTSVTTSDVTAAGTLYLTPHIGNRIRVYDGTRWNEYQNAEISLALTLTNALPYDVFVYDNSGTLTLEVLAWTNGTTRATALTTQDGVYVKNGATTRLYLGTIYASATNQTEDSAAKRFVWNLYNQVPRKLKVADTTNSWTWSGSAYQSANNSTANRVQTVNGLAISLLDLFVVGCFECSGSGGSGAVGIDQNGTSANDADDWTLPQSSGLRQTTIARLHTYPAIGFNFWQWVEYGNTATTTWYGDGGGTLVQGGMTGFILG